MTETADMPQTPLDWQCAVNMAHGALALDAARKYGLVSGGPGVDVERCVEMIETGLQRGYTPQPDATEQFVVALQADAEERRSN